MSDAVSLTEGKSATQPGNSGLANEYADYVQPTGGRTVVIPTERPNQPFNPNDRTVYDADSPEALAYAAVAKSLVKIDAGVLLHQPAGATATNPYRGFGSGFVIDSIGTLSMDAHELDDVDPNGVRVFVNGSWHGAKVVNQTQSNDSAKLRVVPNYPGEEFTPVQLAQAGEHTNGHHYIFGFPGNAMQPFMAVDDPKYPTSKVVRLSDIDSLYAGTGYTPRPGEDPHRPVIQTDLVATSGFSGGPLVNSQGKVEGRDFASDLMVGGYTYSTPIDDLVGYRSEYVAPSGSARPSPVPHHDVRPPAGAAAALAKGLTF